MGLPDLLITITCFSDILGNRMDLYAVVWFDDVMHVANNGLLAAVVIHRAWRRGHLLHPAPIN